MRINVTTPRLDMFLQSKSDLSVFKMPTKALTADRKMGDVIDLATGDLATTGFTSAYMLVNDAAAGTTDILVVCFDARIKFKTIKDKTADLQKAIKDFWFTKNIHVSAQ